MKQRKPSDFVLDMDTEMENGRHKVFIFQMLKLDTKIVMEKLAEVTSSLQPQKSILLLDFL